MSYKTTMKGYKEICPKCGNRLLEKYESTDTNRRKFVRYCQYCGYRKEVRQK